jgi:hypothetical protein
MRWPFFPGFLLIWSADLFLKTHSHPWVCSNKAAAIAHCFLVLLYSCRSLWGMGHPWNALFLFSFLILQTVGRTPWARVQLVAKPLSKHRTTQAQNEHIHTPNIHALCGIRTHDPGFRESEDSTWLIPLGYRDRLLLITLHNLDRKMQRRSLMWRIQHRFVFVQWADWTGH